MEPWKHHVSPSHRAITASHPRHVQLEALPALPSEGLASETAASDADTPGRSWPRTSLGPRSPGEPVGSGNELRDSIAFKQYLAVRHHKLVLIGKNGSIQHIR